jgi:hypothetical protein
VHLEQVIATDKAASRDRIQAIYSKRAGWEFGCSEHKAAPDAVCSCLDDHEAMEFRPRDDSGPCRHEFPAMVEHLLLKMCRVQIQLPQLAGGGSSALVGEAPSLREECERTQRKVQALDTEVAHLNRLVISQDQRLETQEKQLSQVHQRLQKQERQLAEVVHLNQRLEIQERQLSEFRAMIMALQAASPSEGVPPTTRYRRS